MGSTVYWNLRQKEIWIKKYFPFFLLALCCSGKFMYPIGILFLLFVLLTLEEPGFPVCQSGMKTSAQRILPGLSRPIVGLPKSYSVSQSNKLTFNIKKMLE